MSVGETYKALYDTIVKLRSPQGCMWDREQTPSTLREALVEETFECLEAIDENDPDHISEELGDIFLLATMLSYMHEQEGKFTVADVLVKIKEKLIRRHPHVFGEVQVKDTQEILKNWDNIKKIEKGGKGKESILDGVSPGLPPVERAYKLQKKAAKVGFDWPDIEGVILKIQEELEEAKMAVNASTEKLEEECGDLLFSVVNLCRFLKVEPSVALRRTNSKFVERFKYIEEKMKESGQEMKKENLSIMDKYWNEAKPDKKE